MEQKKEEEKKPYTGVPKVEPVDMNPIQQALNSIAGRNTGISLHVPASDGKPAPGLMLAKRFADGGEVEDPMAFLSDNYMTPSGQAMPPATPAPTPAPMAPPLGDVSRSISQTPDTNYDFFKNISAEDRAALQQKLIDSQNSPASMVAQGAAGLGDAISNSFGGKNTSFQKDVMSNTEMQQKKQLDAMDTQRSQRMQDMSGNMEMQSNDPRSPISQSMQKTFKAAGINVPSGMPASMMMKIAPALGELAMKQATMEQQKMLTQSQQEIARQGQKNQALEARSKMDIIDRNFGHKDEYDALGKAGGITPDHGIPDLGQTFNGGKVLKVTRVK